MGTYSTWTFSVAADAQQPLDFEIVHQHLHLTFLSSAESPNHAPARLASLAEGHSTMKYMLNDLQDIWSEHFYSPHQCKGFKLCDSIVGLMGLQTFGSIGYGGEQDHHLVVDQAWDLNH